MGHHDLPARVALASLVLGLAVGLLRILVEIRAPFVAFGDYAEMELTLRHALGGQHLVGMYSHLHYNQLGPALFYVLGPLYVVTGGSGRSLGLTVYLVNGGCAIATVWLARRLLGAVPAIVATVLMAAYLAVVGLFALDDPWLPGVLAMPLLVFLVLAAACAGGRGRAVPPMLLIGTYLVQTYTSVIGVVIATSIVAIALAGLERLAGHRPGNSSRRPGGSRRLGLIVAAVATVALWVPPAIAYGTHAFGNARLMISFFTHSHPELGPYVDLRTAAYALVNQLALVPFGRPTGAATEFQGGRTLISVLALGCAVLAAWNGHRRGRTIARNLGIISLVAVAVTLASLLRVQGDLGEAFVIWWASPILFPGVIGACATLVPADRSAAGPPRLRVSRASVALAGVAVLSCAGLGIQLLRGGLFPSNADVAKGMLVTRPVTGPVSGRVVRLTTIDVGADPWVEGAALQLEKMGAGVHVSGGWVEKYSAPESEVGGESFEILFALAGQKVSPRGTAGARDVGVTGPIEIWVRALPR